MSRNRIIPVEPAVPQTFGKFTGLATDQTPRRQEMALGVTVAGSVFHHLGGLAGNGIEAKILTVPDLITHEQEAAVDNLKVVRRVASQFPGSGQDCRMVPVDIIVWLEKLIRHATFPPCAAR
jgi:hypothetical protein